jgi:hypothetical protein
MGNADAQQIIDIHIFPEVNLISRNWFANVERGGGKGGPEQNARSESSVKLFV